MEGELQKDKVEHTPSRDGNTPKGLQIEINEKNREQSEGELQKEKVEHTPSRDGNTPKELQIKSI